MDEPPMAIDAKERKKQQNRIAQRTYRQNQKQRIRALEKALEASTLPQPSIPIEASLTNTTICEPEPNDNSDGPIDPMWCFHMDDNMYSSNSSVELSSMLDLSVPSVEPSLERAANDLQSEFVNIQESPPSRGRAALHRAVCNKNESMVRLLLEQGAELGRQDHNGQTALHIAVESGQDSLVKVLLDGSDSSVKDSMGRTALFCAVKAGNDTVTKLLLDASIDVNCKDSVGETALHVAVEMGFESSTLLLLSYGADIDA